jgi:hypothetical protein
MENYLALPRGASPKIPGRVTVYSVGSWGTPIFAFWGTHF